jgi:hypothetical protein
VRSFVRARRRYDAGFPEIYNAFVTVIILSVRFGQASVQMPVRGGFGIYVTDDHDWARKF